MLHHYGGDYAPDLYRPGYYVKSTGQARYEVVFEDTGSEVTIFDPESVLTIVKDAEINSVL